MKIVQVDSWLSYYLVFNESGWHPIGINNYRYMDIIRRVDHKTIFVIALELKKTWFVLKSDFQAFFKNYIPLRNL